MTPRQLSITDSPVARPGTSGPRRASRAVRPVTATMTRTDPVQAVRHTPRLGWSAQATDHPQVAPAARVRHGECQAIDIEERA